MKNVNIKPVQVVTQTHYITKPVKPTGRPQPPITRPQPPIRNE